MLLLLLSNPAFATPDGPELFCESYPEAPACATGAVSCAMCHDTSGAPVLNPYGSDVQAQLGDDFGESVQAALQSVGPDDSDGDGLSNAEEIAVGSWPGFTEEIEPECLPQVESGSDWYDLGAYDPLFAWERITLDFCGRSPRYDEVLEMRQQLADRGWLRGDGNEDDARDDEAIVELLHERLGDCLASPYWDDVLEEIAVGVVRPKGYNSDLYILGNYDWDLRLFRYATSGDRDAADLLQATYFVVEEPSDSGILVRIEEPRTESEEFAQPLATEHRYGLITTRFSLAMNVMFAPVPRTLAAHVYRELLGLDISANEGLYPVDEADGAYDWDAPRDVDDKGVWQEGCAACHTTLDPLSYPWARYNGIDLEGDTTGVFLEDRATDVLESVDGAIFGEPISGPDEWVAWAVESDHFSERMVELFFTWLMRRSPYSCEAEEYEALWSGFRDGSYARSGAAGQRVVEEMFHELVLTDLYGTP